MKIELYRKSIHTLLALSLAVLAPYVSEEILLSVGIFLFFAFSILRALRFLNIDQVPRVTFGELFFTIGVLSAVHLAWPNVALFQLAMLILAFSDPFAALIGIPFGKHTYMILDEKRSIEGSAACFALTLLILVAFGIPLLAALIVSVCITFIEAFSLRGSDNLTIPIAVVLLLPLA